MLKSTGASTHPCLTPVHTGKEADSCPPIVTLAFIVMKLSEDVDKLARASKPEQDVLQQVSAQCLKLWHTHTPRHTHTHTHTHTHKHTHASREMQIQTHT